MPRRIKFTKQHEPIKFGDPYNPRSVEGHRNAMIERVETRRLNRIVEERAQVLEDNKPPHAALIGWLRRLIHS